MLHKNIAKIIENNEFYFNYLTNRQIRKDILLFLNQDYQVIRNTFSDRKKKQRFDFKTVFCCQDIEFNIDQNEEANFVGGNFELSFRMRNRGTAKRSVSGRIDVRTMFYTGVVADLVKSETFKKKVIKPGEGN